MKEELENQLYQINPIFFEDAIACKNGTKNEMDTCMFWGCACGDGWFEPLKEFTTKMKYINELAMLHNFKFVCGQLKEKYARCTIYVDVKNTNPDIEPDQTYVKDLFQIVSDLIKRCQEECSYVCEYCGAKSSDLDYTKGWVKLLCKKCRERKNKNVLSN